MKRLEDILERRLLERKQGQLIGLTSEGERLFPLAQEILTRMSETVQRVRKPQLRGKIRLGVPDDFKIDHLHDWTISCLSRNTDLRVEIISASSAQLSTLLESKMLDLVIMKCLATNTNNHLSSRTLRIEPLHWVFKSSTRLDQWPEMPLVTFLDGCIYRRITVSLLDTIQQPYFYSYTSASYDNVQKAIEKGLGIGVLPSSAVKSTHTILSADDGFAELPPVHLVLILGSAGDVFSKFSDQLAEIYSPVQSELLRTLV